MSLMMELEVYGAGGQEGKMDVSSRGAKITWNTQHKFESMKRDCSPCQFFLLLMALVMWSLAPHHGINTPLAQELEKPREDRDGEEQLQDQ